MKQQIAIFASGGGSNALQIINYFNNHPSISVNWVMTNNPDAGVIQHAADAGIAFSVYKGNPQQHLAAILEELKERNIHWIVLAGYLRKIPAALIQRYPGHIINIHPALLPLYGGKGMYGHYVHEAVKAAGDKESGISIHFVDELYDHGRIIFQEKTTLQDTDDAAAIAAKVLALEHAHYAPVLEKLILGSVNGPHR